MIDLFKELDFTQQIQENPQLRPFLIEACKKVEQQQSQHLRKIKKPQLDDELMNQFIVSGIPTLKAEQEKKFLTVFKDKLLASRGIGQKNGLVGITAGMENGVGNATLYLTYRTPAEAKTAFAKLNNLKFDPTHPMSCVWANDIRTLLQQQSQPQSLQFKAPTFLPSSLKTAPNLDSELRSQFLVRQDKLVYLQWLDHLDKSSKTALPDNKQCKQLECQVNKIVFSPKGSYMAVCGNQGLYLFVGNQLEFKGFLRHAQAKDAKFSPDQRFVVSFNGNMNKQRENFVLWAVEEQVKIRAYKAHAHQTLDAFQFSTQNLAISFQNEIFFYTLNSIQDLMKQIRAPQEEQHIIKAPYVQRVAWLKQKNQIIVMCYEPDYSPMTPPSTRIFLYNVESRHERKWRAWGQHAKNGEIFVSEKGEWVAIALRKFIKKGHFATTVQIGNLLKRQQNLQISTLQFKQQVGNISFDSINNRLAVIYKDETLKSINIRYIVSFYELNTRNKTIQVSKIGQIGNTLQNRVVLASNGAFFALYNITEESAEKGRFSLGLITRESKEKGKKVLNFEFTKQNLMVNGMNLFQADPSGRFILLGTEKGYQIWNMIGQIVFKDTLQKNIHDVQWRPRMFNRLPEEEQRAMLEQEKQIRKRYELADDKRMNSLKYEWEEAKKKRKEDFLTFVALKQKWFKGFTAEREKMLGFSQMEARTDKYVVEEDFVDLQ